MIARLLIVEDDPVTAEVLAAQARKARTEFVIDIVSTYIDACKALASSTYDMVLADFDLGGAHNGCEVAYEAPGRTVIMTGHSVDEIASKARKARAFACISKFELIENYTLFDDLVDQANSGGEQASSRELSQQERIQELEQRLVAVIAAVPTAKEPDAKSEGAFAKLIEWIKSNPLVVPIVVLLALVVVLASLLLKQWPGGE